MQYSAVIPAAGIGKRMGLGFNKIKYEIDGQSIIHRTVDIFNQDPDCKEIIIATGKEDIEELNEELKDVKKVKRIVLGGKERQHSIYNALKYADAKYVFCLLYTSDAADDTR